jgi:hypothetical protein
MMQKERLNIVIPVYNPHSGWSDFFIHAVGMLLEELADTDLTVILVNDGSRKEPEDIDRVLGFSPKIKYFSLDRNMGKGYTVRYGIGKEEADFYFYTDADFPFGYEPIVKSYRDLKSSGKNLVIGIRDRKYFKMLPFERECISYMLKWFTSVISLFRLRDTQAPMKAMDNKARKVLLETKTDGFIFDFEFLLNCLKKKISFSSIGITPRRNIAFTDFRLNFLKKQCIDVFKVIFR